MRTDGQQSGFLARAMETGRRVNLITTNGYQMRGRISGFDRRVIVLETDGARQLVYKHAVSTIVPEDA